MKATIIASASVRRPLIKWNLLVVCDMSPWVLVNMRDITGLGEETEGEVYNGFSAIVLLSVSCWLSPAKVSWSSLLRSFSCIQGISFSLFLLRSRLLLLPLPSAFKASPSPSSFCIEGIFFLILLYSRPLLLPPPPPLYPLASLHQDPLLASSLSLQDLSSRPSQGVLTSCKYWPLWPSLMGNSAVIVCPTTVLNIYVPPS